MSIKLTDKRCRCPTCGEVFSNINNFDRHRVGEHGSKVCVYPSCVSLSKRFYGEHYVWVRESGKVVFRAEDEEEDECEFH